MDPALSQPHPRKNPETLDFITRKRVVEMIKDFSDMSVGDFFEKYEHLFPNKLVVATSEKLAEMKKKLNIMGEDLK